MQKTIQTVSDSFIEQEIDENLEMEKSYTPHSTDKLQCFSNFRHFSSSMDAVLDTLFAKYSLSLGRFNLILELDKEPTGLKPSDLAERCKVTQATISGLLSSLEKKQIVERLSHQNDGRACIIRLTEKGKELYKQVLPDFSKKIDQIFDSLNSQEAELLKSFFNKLNESAQKDLRLN